MAQRLVKRVCPDCKERYKPTRENLIGGGLDIDKYMDYPFYAGRGCSSCNDTGVLGREAIFEVLLMTDEIRQMIIDNVSLIQIPRPGHQGGNAGPLRQLPHQGPPGAPPPLADLEKICHE